MLDTESDDGDRFAMRSEMSWESTCWSRPQLWWDPMLKWAMCKKAIRLNRLLRLYPPGAEGGERWELEADPRHVEISVSQMGLRNESKAVSTLGVRTTDKEDGKELDA